MSENLTKKIRNYALYLPSMPESYAEVAITRGPVRNLPVRPLDLNFMKPSNRRFHYKYCLASAGRFARRTNSNAITSRNPNNTFVLGDSGGFQAATGAFKEAPAWRDEANIPGRVPELWLSSTFRHELIHWADANCNYAMTLDMPLWVRKAKSKSSPFHGLTIDQLADLTVENLHLTEKIRRRCRFLNVLQGEDQAEADYWYSRVGGFNFEGWAYGSRTNVSGGLLRLLRRVLLLRDEHMLGGRRRWFHVLGLSGLVWAVALTAVQRGIQSSTGADFTVSFDSATPFLWAGKFKSYAAPPLLSGDIKTWTIPKLPFPTGYRVARQHGGEPFPSGSPISNLLTIGDMNPNQDTFAVTSFDPFSTHLLGNHNVYVFIKAIINANRVAFQERNAPQQIAELVGIIGDLFKADDWQGLLAKQEAVLTRSIRAAPILPDAMEEPR